MCTYNMAALEPFSIEQGKGGGLSWRGSENSTHTHTPKSEIIINKNRLHQLKILRSTYLAYSWVLSVAIGHLLPSSSFPFSPPPLSHRHPLVTKWIFLVDSSRVDRRAKASASLILLFENKPISPAP